MLIKDGDCFRLYPWKVRYRQHGQEIEQWALPSKEWWTDFADRWEHTEILEFIEVELTEEQLARFEQVKHGIPEAFREVCVEYILDGKFPDEGVSCTITKLQMLKNNMERKEDIDFVADSAVIALMDIDDVAEMLVYALQKIDELEARIDG